MYDGGWRFVMEVMDALSNLDGPLNDGVKSDFSTIVVEVFVQGAVLGEF